MIRFFLLLIFVSQGASAQVLKLSEYLSQVKSSGAAGKAAELKDSSTELALRASEQVTALRLTGSASYFDDGRPTLNPSFQGENTLVKAYSLGLQQQTSFGPKWGLSLNQSETLISGPGLIIQQNHFFDVYPKLDVSVPLWRNFLGSETKATRDQLLFQTQAARSFAKLTQAQRTVEAELAYYKLAIARQQLLIAKDSFDRAQKIMNWAQSRARRNLGEESDFFQAQAAVQGRRLEVLQIENSIGDLERQFNIIRGIDSSQVKEKLEYQSFNPTDLNLVNEKKRRLDLEASEFNLKATQAGAALQVQQSRPTVDLQFQKLIQGRARDISGAYSSYSSGDYDQWALSLQVSTALDWTLSNDLNKAAQMDVEAANLQLERDRLDSADAWETIKQKSQLLKNSIQIARELETLQGQKAQAERQNLNRGRSTTFQVLSFEKDYANSRLNLLNLELQGRQLISQIKLFE